MASDKTYVVAQGLVEKFGEKPVVQTRDANGQQVHGFTINGILSEPKSGAVKACYVGVSLWSELAALAPHVAEGMFVAVEGAYTRSEGQNGAVFHNVSAQRISVCKAVERAEREVVNTPAAADPTAAAPSGSPF